MTSRRAFLGGLTASAAGVIVGGPASGGTGPAPLTYEVRLANEFQIGRAGLNQVVLAHIGGFAARLPEWLAKAVAANPNRDFDALRRRFEIVLSADVHRIETLLLTSGRETLPADWLSGQDQAGAEQIDRGLAQLIVQPLTLLGRGDVLAALHANSLQRLEPGKSSKLTMDAVRALGEAGDWSAALDILERARLTCLAIPVTDEQQEFLWQNAYLHREVERVMPVLAQMPFHADKPIRKETAEWILKSYQIRAGMSGIAVPAIKDETDQGYIQAATMQIATLEGHPGSAREVEALRRAVLPGRNIEIIHTNRRTKQIYNPVESALFRARAEVAARRKDYSAAAKLAGTVLRNSVIDPPSDVVEAFLEEGDWRAAANIVKAHDPRKKRRPRGYESEGPRDYMIYHEHLAVAAARAGDDGAAAAFFNTAKDEYRSMQARWPDEYKADRYVWRETLLTGVAEGRLPRRYLHVFFNTFLRSG